jgi:hypothetical protein
VSQPERPPRLPIPNGWQLVVDYQHSGQPAQSVVGLALPSGQGPTAQGAQIVLNAWWARMRALCSAEVVCQGGTLREAVPEGSILELNQPPNPAGTIAGTTTIAGYATLIKWTTNQGGRSGKGRTYLPGVTQGVVQSGGRTYSSAHQTAASAAIAGYLSDVQTGLAYSPVVLSFRKGQAFTVTGGALSSVVAIQRRRMR